MKAWYAQVSSDRHRLFVGRHYHDVAIDDNELVVTTRRGRVVLKVPTDSLRVERVRGGPLLQVLARGADDNTHVFEFRARHHAEGRALARELSATHPAPSGDAPAEPPR